MKNTKEQITNLKSAMFKALSREEYELASQLKEDIKTLEVRSAL